MPPLRELFGQPVELPGEAVDVAMGPEHACAVTRGGQLYCWGSNEDGQLGTGHVEPQRAPVRVPGLDEVVEVVGGDAHSCARRRDGSVYCWGSNVYGAAGHDTAYVGAGVRLVRPVRVTGISEVDHLFARGSASCAYRRGELWCWGVHIGTGPTPTRVAGPRSFVTMTLDASYHWLCFTPGEQGRVRCRRADGRASPRFIPLPGAVPASQMTLGAQSVCVLGIDRVLRCRMHQDRSPPEVLSVEPPVPDLPRVYDVDRDLDSERVCAVGAEVVRCWSPPPGTGPTETVALPPG